jgi:uncharacterized protein YdeI (YjbR/CyaY-like superfamily)
MKAVDYLEFTDRDEWRLWLTVHSQDCPKAWLFIAKKSSQGKLLNLDEAVEEALCFGWIDGPMHSIDAEKFALQFSPRKPGSVWSYRNIQRVNKLIREGRITEPGLVKVAEAHESRQWEAAIQREDPEYLPKDLEQSLRSCPGALSSYAEQTNSWKKQRLYWITSAKKADTRRKRIREVVRSLGFEPGQAEGNVE